MHALPIIHTRKIFIFDNGILALRKALLLLCNGAFDLQVRFHLLDELHSNIYHFDTSDQREEPVYKSHITHLSVRYKK